MVGQCVRSPPRTTRHCIWLAHSAGGPSISSPTRHIACAILIDAAIFVGRRTRERNKDFPDKREKEEWGTLNLISPGKTGRELAPASSGDDRLLWRLRAQIPQPLWIRSPRSEVDSKEHGKPLQYTLPRKAENLTHVPASGVSNDPSFGEEPGSLLTPVSAKNRGHY